MFSRYNHHTAHPQLWFGEDGNSLVVETGGKTTRTQAKYLLFMATDPEGRKGSSEEIKMATFVTWNV